MTIINMPFINLRWSILIFFALMALPSWAQVAVGVDRFEDRTYITACKETKGFKKSLPGDLYKQMARSLKDGYLVNATGKVPQYRISGSVQAFEVCPSMKKDRNFDAHLVLSVGMLSDGGATTHMYSSTVKVSGPISKRAVEMAVEMGVAEIYRRIDVTIASNSKVQPAIASNEYKLKMVRRKPAAAPLK